DTGFTDPNSYNKFPGSRWGPSHQEQDLLLRTIPMAAHDPHNAQLQYCVHGPGASRHSAFYRSEFTDLPGRELPGGHSPRVTNAVNMLRPNPPLGWGVSSDSLTWLPGQLYHDSYKDFGPSIRFSWDPQ